MLTGDYKNHIIFKELDGYSNFYKLFSFSILGFVKSGVTGSHFNIDTYVYSSIQATIESIKDILLKGHISDSYTLLRKY
ncbi:MAG TPA: hypothetical protein VGO21_01835, partial [Candidatus Paceibacterota bacterium]|nr:hypothetical protein [Candidatus Paceibacterota bacterium]